jgi:hypothetical protein
MKETKLLARDAQRDLNAELLESIAEMKAGKVGRVSLVTRDGQVRLTNEEITLINERDKSAPRPVNFE